MPHSSLLRGDVMAIARSVPPQIPVLGRQAAHLRFGVFLLVCPAHNLSGPCFCRVYGYQLSLNCFSPASKCELSCRRQRSWGCQRLCSSQPKANQTQRVNRFATLASQGLGQPTLEMEASDQMRRLGEDAQEAFASGNPDTLRQDGGDMMEVCI